MNVPIIQEFIPVGRRNRPVTWPAAGSYRKLMEPQYVTVHDTGNRNPYADAEAHAAYLLTSTAANKPISWHFTVDDRLIYQHLPLNENGWHAGDGASGTGNRKSIGIELCMNDGSDRARTELNGAWLVAKLLKDFGLGIALVKQHHYWSGKNCPQVLRSRSGGWQGFLNQVGAFMTNTVLRRHTVQPGESLSVIAPRYGITWQDLALHNGIRSPYIIHPGQTLEIPGTGLKPDIPKPVLNNAVLPGGDPDFESAKKVAIHVEGAMHFREAPGRLLEADKIYVVGGSAQGLPVEKVVNLSGRDRLETARKVEEFLKK